MRDQPVRAKVFHDAAADQLRGKAFAAILEYPNGVRVDVEAPTFRKLKNTLRSFGLNVDELFDFQVPEGMGFLERALR